MENSLKKALGIIYGLAIGDALGRPTEFISREEIKKRFGEDGIQELPDPALFTDDTQMAIAIAETLTKTQSFYVEDFMKELKIEFVNWLNSPENNRGPGRTCLTGCRNMELGQPWQESGVKESMGCGTAMRVAPIAFVLQYDPALLENIAHVSGICTHRHRGADAACLGTAWLVKLALENHPLNEFIPAVLDFTKGISSEFTECIEKVRECMEWENEEKALDYLGEGWIGPEATALALYCLKYPNDYKKTVIRGANTNGDSDSIACIAGAISGAYLGIDGIPTEWVQSIEKKDYLYKLAVRIMHKTCKQKRKAK